MSVPCCASSGVSRQQFGTRGPRGGPCRGRYLVAVPADQLVFSPGFGEQRAEQGARRQPGEHCRQRVFIDGAAGFRFGIDGRAEWQRTLSDGNGLLASFTGIEQWMPVGGLSMARQGSLFGLGFNAQWKNGSLLRLDVGQRRSELGDNGMVKASYRYRF